MADLGPWKSESHFMQAGGDGYAAQRCDCGGSTV